MQAELRGMINSSTAARTGVSLRALNKKEEKLLCCIEMVDEALN
jgi:hypothetical protein